MHGILTQKRIENMDADLSEIPYLDFHIKSFDIWDKTWLLLSSGDFSKGDFNSMVVGWGGSYGYLITAVRELQHAGHKVSLVNFNYINPLPKNVKDVFRKFSKILVCELNLGQFADYLRIKHQEFTYDIKDKCIQMLEDK